MKILYTFLLAMLFLRFSAQANKTTIEPPLHFDIGDYKNWNYDPDHILDNTTRQEFRKKIKNENDAKLLYLSKGKDRIIIIKSASPAEISVTRYSHTQPYSSTITYSDTTHKIITFTHAFYNSEIGIARFYDNGKLLKTVDTDLPYKFKLPNLIEKFRKEYDIDLEKQEIDHRKRHFTSFERSAFSPCSKTPIYNITKKDDDVVDSYYIDGTTGKTLFHLKTAEDVILNDSFCKAMESDHL